MAEFAPGLSVKGYGLDIGLLFWALDPGKAKNKLVRTFTITKVFPYRTIELSQPDGLNFKVNVHRVKHYFEGDLPPKAIQDLHTLSKDE
ncbi:hypothetical protein Tco_0903761 [Tanacetum coccineum]